ncbi:MULTISPECIES: GlxA family transcriptional regulator [Acetobacteraceae]|uniref:GlxA family transcriptional regulator n=1 Tax=Acetobacteraceae TaxID=433 RepID=UPI0039EC1C4E
MPKQIGVLLYPDFQLLDAAGVMAVFEIAGAFGGTPYEMTPLSQYGGKVRSSSGMVIETVPLAAAVPFDTLVVVGGEGHKQAMTCPELQIFIRHQANTARRICSVCTGAFLLAASGLLDGRRVTTHWQQANAMAEQFPKVQVLADAIHVHDGLIWTSAGISAGIDMALSLVSEDLGADIGRRTAKQMVVFYHRPGGQSQFSALLEMESTQERFSGLLGWIRSNLQERLTVETLANQAGMSPRNFSRSFRTAVGMSPARAVERLRLEAARERVECSTIPIEAIATMTGFHDPERMRRAFVREFHEPPQAMRRNANTTH